MLDKDEFSSYPNKDKSSRDKFGLKFRSMECLVNCDEEGISSSLHKNEISSKKNASTLSLHIAAYENAIEGSKIVELEPRKCKEIENPNGSLCFNDISWPRLMASDDLTPETMKFSTSKKLWTPPKTQFSRKNKRLNSRDFELGLALQYYNQLQPRFDNYFFFDKYFLELQQVINWEHFLQNELQFEQILVEFMALTSSISNSNGIVSCSGGREAGSSSGGAKNGGGEKAPKPPSRSSSSKNLPPTQQRQQPVKDGDESESSSEGSSSESDSSENKSSSTSSSSEEKSEEPSLSSNAQTTGAKQKKKNRKATTKLFCRRRVLGGDENSSISHSEAALNLVKKVNGMIEGCEHWNRPKNRKLLEFLSQTAYGTEENPLFNLLTDLEEKRCKLDEEQVRKLEEVLAKKSSTRSQHSQVATEATIVEEAHALGPQLADLSIATSSSSSNGTETNMTQQSTTPDISFTQESTILNSSIAGSFFADSTQLQSESSISSTGLFAVTTTTSHNDDTMHGVPSLQICSSRSLIETTSGRLVTATIREYMEQESLQVEESSDLKKAIEIISREHTSMLTLMRFCSMFIEKRNFFITLCNQLTPAATENQRYLFLESISELRLFGESRRSLKIPEQTESVLEYSNVKRIFDENFESLFNDLQKLNKGLDCLFLLPEVELKSLPADNIGKYQIVFDIHDRLVLKDDKTLLKKFETVNSILESLLIASTFIDKRRLIMHQKFMKLKQSLNACSTYRKRNFQTAMLELQQIALIDGYNIAMEEIEDELIEVSWDDFNSINNEVGVLSRDSTSVRQLMKALDDPTRLAAINEALTGDFLIPEIDHSLPQ